MKNKTLVVLAAAVLGLAACGTPSGNSSVAPAPAPVSSSIQAEAETWTVKEAIEWCDAQDATKETANDVTVTITGVMEGLNHEDAYGNFYLSAGGKSIKVYGSTTTATAFDKSVAGTVAFTNPKDAKETLKDYNNGDVVTVDALVVAYKGQPELKVVVTGKAANSEKYAASVTVDGGHGTATISKNADLAYGEAITVTAAPENGYRVKSVVNKPFIESNAKNNDLFSGTVSASNANVYTIPAMTSNKIVVTFEAIPQGTVKTYNFTTGEYSGTDITFSSTVSYKANYKEYVMDKYSDSKDTPSIKISGLTKATKIEIYIYNSYWNFDGVYAGANATGTKLDATAPKPVASTKFGQNKEFVATLEYAAGTDSFYMESKDSAHTIGIFGFVVYCA